MRALFVFGAVALYIGCAFVTPSQANVHAMVMAAGRLKPASVTSLLSAASKPIMTITDTVKKVAKDPKTTVLVDAAGKALSGDKKAAITSATSVAVSALPDVQTVARTLSKVIAKHDDRMTAAFAALMANTADASVKAQFERIEWAAEKADPRLCKTLADNNVVTTGSAAPSFGDLLALCLARTTGDATRCSQIDSVTGAALKSACDEGLASQG